MAGPNIIFLTQLCELFSNFGPFKLIISKSWTICPWGKNSAASDLPNNCYNPFSSRSINSSIFVSTIKDFIPNLSKSIFNPFQELRQNSKSPVYPNYITNPNLGLCTWILPHCPLNCLTILRICLIPVTPIRCPFLGSRGFEFTGIHPLR